MVQLNAEGVKEYFAVGIAFNVVAGLVEFLYNGFLLADAAELVQAEGKIEFVVHTFSVWWNELHPYRHLQ